MARRLVCTRPGGERLVRLTQCRRPMASLVRPQVLVWRSTALAFPAQLLGDQAPLGPHRLTVPQAVLDGEQFGVSDRQAVRLADHAREVGALVVAAGEEGSRDNVHRVLRVHQVQHEQAGHRDAAGEGPLWRDGVIRCHAPLGVSPLCDALAPARKE